MRFTLTANKRDVAHYPPRVVLRHAYNLPPIFQRGVATTKSRRNAIDMKRNNLETVVMVMWRNISEIENRREKFKGGE